MGWSEALNSIGSGAGSTVWMIVWIVVIGGLALLLLGGGFFYWYFKKKWNLRVEIKLIRSDGKITLGEWGKGFFNSKQGVVYIRRKGRGFKPIPMKVFDVRKYLQGENLLTVIQVAPDDYRPVLNESWQSYVDDETGERCAMIDVKVDKGLNKAWKTAFTAAAKKAYSLQSFLSQFQTPIAIGIVIICSFVGFAILWSRIGSVC